MYRDRGSSPNPILATATPLSLAGSRGFRKFLTRRVTTPPRLDQNPRGTL